MEEDPTFFMPSEWSPHAGTIMAWPTAERISQAFAGSDIEATWTELSHIATAISQFEPVHVFVRDPKSYTAPDPTKSPQISSGFASAHALLQGTTNIKLHVTRNVESLWARDSGAVFVRTTHGQTVTNSWDANDTPGPGFHRRDTSSQSAGLLLGFQQWGRSYAPSPDSYLAFTTCQALGVSAVQGPWVSEGGSIEVDGVGTMITTESSMANVNRNPGLSKSRLERYFAEFLGVKKTIWLKGQRGWDNTDGHVDCLARFTERQGTVLLSRRHGDQDEEVYTDAMRSLHGCTDALGRELSVVTIQEPDARQALGEECRLDAGPCVSYVNFQIVNGGVIMPAFGDETADEEAKKIVQSCFPARKVVQVRLRQLALQGGGIHCATKQFVR